MPTIEKRERRIVDACELEVRSNPDGTFGVSGYAIVYDVVAHGEVIRSSAFTRSLEQRDNIRFLVNHEGTPVASTRAGTMTLENRPHGLWFDIPSLDPASPRAMELVSAVSRGDLYQCSFAMTATDDPVVDGVREVREGKLWELSAVTFPWYEDTSIGMTGDRSLDRALVAIRSLNHTIAEVRTDALRALRAAPPGRQSYNDVATAITEAIYRKLESAGATDPYMWLDDFGPGWAVYTVYSSGCRYWQIDWSQSDDGTIDLGNAFEVDRVTQYLAIADGEEPRNLVTPATRASGDEPATDAPNAEPAETPPPEPEVDEPRTYSPAEARALLAPPVSTGS